MLKEHIMFFARKIYWELNPVKHFEFFNDYRNFVNQYKDSSRTLPKIVFEPTIHDKNASNFDDHYINHPYWAIEKIKQFNPRLHVDISSYIPFVAFLSPFIKVFHLDYNPPPIKLPNVITGRADLKALPFNDNSIESLSCMHVVEHIGLGRYGDDVDIDGDIKAIKELQRVLKPRGNLYFVVPVGQECIYYNAHRIYPYDTIINTFNELKLVEFSLVYKHDPFITYNADPELVKDCEYGCGLFHFTKE